MIDDANNPSLEPESGGNTLPVDPDRFLEEEKERLCINRFMRILASMIIDQQLEKKEKTHNT
jgi:hypothetical protein